jgi:pimeloyl-ACP methyl ester carboxylesterase
MEVMRATGLEYSEDGEGDPVLLVHAGGFADWFAPLAASPTLAGYRIVRVRRAGYGLNRPDTSLTLADHAFHLAQLAESLGLKKVHVVGHSSGALIALELATRRQHLVQTLTLIEPAACGPFQVPAIAAIGERFVGPAMASFAAGDVPGAFHSFMRGVCGERYREVIESALGSSGLSEAISQSSYFFRDEIPAAMKWQFTPECARNIQAPTLVVEGAAGRSEGDLSRQVTEVATRLFPESELILIDGANHLLPLQKPDALGLVLATFFHRHRMTATAGSHRV